MPRTEVDADAGRARASEAATCMRACVRTYTPARTPALDNKGSHVG